MAKTKFEKLDLQTKDLTAINIQKIGELFPNVITEYETEQGEITKGIDFELLQQLLSKELVDGTKEKYQLNWPGKKAALLKANTPITETLRPDIANSKNWDNTENIFIEGDNFTALKILQESYLGKIKMIYIDPPYNTGKDFVYSDKFTIDKSEYAEKIGQYDEENNKLFKENTRTNPRYHSDWLSMMYERLHIARDLLREDGVIFISIDDNEVHNLRKICDEIFGEENFIAKVIWERSFAPVNLKKYFSESHDYILVFAKNLSQIDQLTLSRSSESDDRYKNPDNDSRGVWQSGDFSVGPAVPQNVYEITTPSGKKVLPPNGRSWRVSQTKFQEMLANDEVWFGNDGNGVPRQKRFLINVKQGVVPMTLWKYTEVGHSQDATKRLKELFDDKMYFDYPKPVGLIQKCLDLSTNNEDIIVDFFAGSGTTAHAVMQLNAEDGGNRKFIMVQLDEETDEKSEAYKAGYKTIAELSRERIRRAGEKIVADNKDKLATRETELDIGFRAFRVDSTNMKDVYYHPKDLKQDNLLDLVDTIKADRTPEDLLIQVLLDKALTLDLPIKTQKFKNNTVYIVGDNDLIVCMDTVLDADIIDDLAQLGADTAVFRDSSFATEADRIKLETHFKRLSPRDTRILVI